MSNVLYDELAIQMYPSGLLHHFGVNGKVSGSIGAIGEMQGVIPIIHGPAGCAFHYRYSARRRHEPFYNVMTSALEQPEIICGGEEKLKEEIRKIWKRYAPGLILIVPSPVSDILNEDLLEVARSLREQEGIPVAAVKSELFSHRDKNYTRNRMKELANQKITGDNRLSTDLKGCGFTEVLTALVEQVMEPCEKEPLSINIETVGWGSEGVRALPEIEQFLNRAGVRVNTWIPSAPLGDLVHAPKAALNVAKRVRWARKMKERFGTDFIHLSGARYEGLDGICTFYQDIGDALGIGETMAMLVEAEKERVLAATASMRAELGTYRCMLLDRGISMAPFHLKKYREDYGFPIQSICLFVTEDARVQGGITEELLTKFLKRVEEARDTWAPGAEILLNPSEEELAGRMKKADLILGTNDFRYEGKGAPLLPEKLELLSLSFESYVRSVERVARHAAGAQEKTHLLLNQMPITQESFPFLENGKNECARELWNQMWLNKKRDEP